MPSTASRCDRTASVPLSGSGSRIPSAKSKRADVRRQFVTVAHAAETGRVEAFSDGVFAIAITLLILEIAVPASRDGGLGCDLLHLWPSYLAYAASFFTIGIMWMNHHYIFGLIRSVNRPLLLINLALLAL